MVLCEKHRPFPPDHGRAMRLVTLAGTLRARGLRVTLLVCEGAPGALPDGTSVRTVPLSAWPLRDLLLWSRLRRIHRGLRVDFFQVQNDVFPLVALLARLSGFRVLYDAQVVERDYWSALRPASLRERASSWILPVCEKLLCGIAERVTALSEPDAARLSTVDGLSREKVFVVPLSPRAPVEDAARSERTEAHPVVLFLGSYGHRPNADAIDLIAKEIRPRVLRSVPDAAFRIVGKGLPVDRLRSLGLEPHSDVPEVAPLIDAATVCIAPIRVGSGVRTKLIEYMSRGKPVVAMPPALEGMSLRPGEDLLVADDLDAFAEDVVHLIRDVDARRRLGAAGLARIRAGEGQDRTERTLLALYA